MPGGLLQLVGVGAQNELVNGNPSLTHFRAVYRKHTNFAMESIRMTFGSSNLQFSPTGLRTISCRIDRYAQLLHDTYLVLTLPDVWSPLVKLPAGKTPPVGYDQRSGAIGYEFQWIQNIGYNLIDNVTITANGTVLQTLRGEWLKFYSYLTHDANKRRVVDQMIGNVPDMYDPANAYDRVGQYPHAITPNKLPGTTVPNTKVPEPSIRSRQLIIPLHFWFCENPGMALPLVSMQNTDVTINVTYRSLTELYSVIDVNPLNATFGQRVRPTQYPMSLFLSPPDKTGAASNPTLSTFFPDPYLEGNFIYLSDMEMNQLALSDQTFLVKTVNYTLNTGQYGGNSDVLIPMFNLVTRVVFSSQRSDKILTNAWDNYTNWDNPKRAPFTSIGVDGNNVFNNTYPTQTFLYSSGQQQVSSVYPRDPITDGVLMLDGKERFGIKPTSYFSLIQMYKHTTGVAPSLPGVYQYSFALNHDQYQPSGALNGSMYDKVTVRLTLQQPLPSSVASSTQQVVTALKSTLASGNPLIVCTPTTSLPLNPDGTPMYTDDQLVKIVVNKNGDNVIYSYTYNLGVYVESINFLRIVSGLANFVFAN